MRKAHKSASGYNLAVQHCLKKAFDEQGNLDYSRLQFSQGRLTRPYSVQAWRDSGMVRVEWSTLACDEAGQDGLIHVLIYDPEQQIYYPACPAFPRSLGYAFIPLPQEAIGRMLHIYLFTASATQPKLFSDSVHQCLPALNP